jgi:hypothetical protein
MKSIMKIAVVGLAMLGILEIGNIGAQQAVGLVMCNNNVVADIKEGYLVVYGECKFFIDRFGPHDIQAIVNNNDNVALKFPRLITLSTAQKGNYTVTQPKNSDSKVDYSLLLEKEWQETGTRYMRLLLPQVFLMLLMHGKDQDVWTPFITLAAANIVNKLYFKDKRTNLLETSLLTLSAYGIGYMLNNKLGSQLSVITDSLNKNLDIIGKLNNGMSLFVSKFLLSY